MLRTVSGLSGRVGTDPRADLPRLPTAQPFGQATTMADDLSEGGLMLSEETVEEIKDSVELSQSLQRASERMEDGSRSMKVQEIKQKIELLKQRLQFATPDQARELQRELKQLAKDFKQVASDLSSSGADLAATGLSPPNVQGSEEAGADPQGDDAGAAAVAGAVAGADVVAEPVVVAQAGGPGGVGGARPPGAGSAGAPGAAAGEDAGADAAEEPSQGELKAALSAYVGEQVKEEDAVARARARGMQDESEKLKEIAEELKRLGKQIDSLARRGQDDDDLRRSQAGETNRAIEDGLAELRDPRFLEGIAGALSGAPLPEGTAADLPVAPVSSAGAQQASLAYAGGGIGPAAVGLLVSSFIA